MCMVPVGTRHEFRRLPDDACYGNMLTFMPAGMMLVFKRKQRRLFRLPGGTAPGMDEGMMLRLDFGVTIIRYTGNESKRSNCCEPERAQQHTIAYTLFHIYMYHHTDYTVLGVFESILLP